MSLALGIKERKTVFVLSLGLLALNIEQAILDESVGNGVICNIAKDARNPAKGLVRSEEHTEKLRLANTGRKLSEESRSKMSASRMGHSFNVGIKQKPEHIAKRALSNTGKKRSEETKALFSASKMGNTYNLGKKLTEEQILNLSIVKGKKCVIDGKQFHSCNEAARQLHISPQTVVNRCNSDNFKDWQYGL